MLGGLTEIGVAEVDDVELEAVTGDAGEELELEDDGGIGPPVLIGVEYGGYGDGPTGRLDAVGTDPVPGNEDEGV